MTDPKLPDITVEVLGDALNIVAHQALDAFTIGEPEVGAQILAEMVAGTAITQCLCQSGGGQPAFVAVGVIRPDGTRQALARLKIALPVFN